MAGDNAEVGIGYLVAENAVTNPDLTNRGDPDIAQVRFFAAHDLAVDVNLNDSLERGLGFTVRQLTPDDAPIQPFVLD